MSYEDVAAGVLGLFPRFSEAEERISLALYRQLALGDAVAEEDLVRASDVDGGAVERALSGWPGVYRDSGRRIIGYGGLTICETRHRLTVRGRRVYAWCAWDTLFLPDLLGVTARVESSCPVTGERISLSVDGEGAKPDGSPPCVSLIAPDPSKVAEDVVLHFCHFIHFFVRRGEANRWVAQHPGTLLVTLEEAWDLGRRRNALLYPRSLRCGERERRPLR